MIISSIQVGQVITEGDPDQRDVRFRQWTTGFYKCPVGGPVKLTVDGLVGDSVADTRFHGGPDKAVLCYASAHYEHWRTEHPDLDFAAGGFGENLTVNEATESEVCIGDVYAVGEGCVQVSQPRQPCWKISRRWGVKTLTKEVAATGRTGWYLRVIQAGLIHPNDSLQLLRRPHPDWSVARANDVLFGREKAKAVRNELIEIAELSPDWKSSLG